LSGSRSPDVGAGFPSASIAFLTERARLLAASRRFFEARGVLEVETPVLCAAGAVDEHLEPIPAEYHPEGGQAPGLPFYLVTSPEHSMKRLLASGSGPIYQITRAFRDGERGRLHNPEFTILEWYRPGFDHVRLMDEVEALIAVLLGGAPGYAVSSGEPFQRITYADAFRGALRIDPHTASAADLALAAAREGVPRPPGFPVEDRDAWLDLLLSQRVEKTLGAGRPVFITDYPPSQAALAKVRPGNPPVAERFELYAKGIELANGYHELLDPREQERRFEEANARRRSAGKVSLPLDHRFLAALEAGMPASAGVAVGFDRVVMIAVGASSIDEVMAFPIERA
jgi:elongation factor P--(R)-beta-lysine ligase